MLLARGVRLASCGLAVVLLCCLGGVSGRTIVTTKIRPHRPRDSPPRWHSVQPHLVLNRIDADRPLDELVHVLYTTDADLGMDMATVASIYSAIYNMEDPGRLRFHIIVPELRYANEICRMLIRFADRKPMEAGGPENRTHTSFMADSESVKNYMPFPMPPQCKEIAHSEEQQHSSCICGSMQFRMQMLSNSPDILDKIDRQAGMFREHGKSIRENGKGNRARQSHLSNFARNFAPELLLDKGIKKVIYLDPDTIIQKSLSELWEIEMKEDKYVLLATELGYKKAYKHMNNQSQLMWSIIGDENADYYNTGVMVMDLEQLSHIGLNEKISELIRHHTEVEHIWNLGIQQPSFVLAVYPYIQVVNSKWNVHAGARGGKCTFENPARYEKRFANGAILHFKGRMKPWMKRGCRKDRWEPYALDLKPKKTLVKTVKKKTVLSPRPPRAEGIPAALELAADNNQ